MTALTVRSIQHVFGRTTSILIIIDDIEASQWPNYDQDVAKFIQQSCPSPSNLQIKKFSQLLGTKDYLSGWWRQQLVKLCSDFYLPDHIEQWLLVDGDVVFDQPVDLDLVPVAFPVGNDDTIGVLFHNYVRKMLGTDRPYIELDGKIRATSPIPFRKVSRSLLSRLRNHIESRFNKNILDLHHELIQSGEIVAYEPTKTKMAMSEWKLIEVYRQQFSGNPLPVKHTGPGSHTLTHTSGLSGLPIRHSSMKDYELGKEWFGHQHLVIDAELWNKSQIYSQKFKR